MEGILCRTTKNNKTASGKFSGKLCPACYFLSFFHCLFHLLLLQNQRLTIYFKKSVLKIDRLNTVAWLEASVTILGSPQNESNCIYKGRGRLPRPSKSHLQKTKPNLQMALSGTGQSAPSQVDTSVHILGCTQLVNVSSNHAMVAWWVPPGTPCLYFL